MAIVCGVSNFRIFTVVLAVLNAIGLKVKPIQPSQLHCKIFSLKQMLT